MPTPADGAVGALDWSSKERKRLAKLSRDFCCPTCGKIESLLPKLDPNKKPKGNRFSKEIEKLQQLQQMAEGPKNQNEGEQKDESKTEDDSKADKKASVEIASISASGDRKLSATPFVASSAPAAASMDRSNTSTAIDVATTSSTPSSSVQVETVTVEGGTSAATTSETSGLLDGDESRVTAVTAATAGNNVQENAVDANPTWRVNDDRAAAVEESSLSWVYDPILNLMIVLLAAVCWLLWQKFVDLREELTTLREQNLLLE